MQGQPDEKILENLRKLAAIGEGAEPSPPPEQPVETEPEELMESPVEEAAEDETVETILENIKKLAAVERSAGMGEIIEAPIGPVEPMKPVEEVAEEVLEEEIVEEALSPEPEKPEEREGVLEKAKEVFEPRGGVGMSREDLQRILSDLKSKIDEQETALEALEDISTNLIDRSELEQLGKIIKREEISALKESFERYIEETIPAIRHRMGEQESAIKKAAEQHNLLSGQINEHLEGLEEVKNTLYERLGAVSKDLEETIGKGAGESGIAQLEREKQSIVDTITRLEKDREQELISEEIYSEIVEGARKQLEKIDAEIAELR